MVAKMQANRIILYSSQVAMFVSAGWVRDRDFIVHKCLWCHKDMDRCKCEERNNDLQPDATNDTNDTKEELYEELAVAQTALQVAGWKIELRALLAKRTPMASEKLLLLISTFEATWPNHCWLLRKLDTPPGYLASAFPYKTIGKINGPNPTIHKCEAPTPEEALTNVIQLLTNEQTSN